MERGSDKHGRRLDEALEKETRAMVQAGRETRGEEWKSAEPSGEDQPDVALSPEQALSPADLAALLGKEIWPAEGVQVKQRVADMHGPDLVVDLVDRLPDGRVYTNVAEVWEDLQAGRS